jgi:hypothetical protein
MGSIAGSWIFGWLLLAELLFPSEDLDLDLLALGSEKLYRLAAGELTKAAFTAAESSWSPA